MQASTVRSALEPTVLESTNDQDSRALTDAIISQWEQSRQADMVAVLHMHPSLLRHRSLLLSLAIEEYRIRHDETDAVDLNDHCGRFQQFGSSLQRSIQRQLGVQRFLDERPQLLDEPYSVHWPAVGDKFGDFCVTEELGLGSVARVYLCTEPEVGNRQVVVKVTPLRNFEASILGRLNHPNIIPIYYTGFLKDWDLYFVCMPFCGRSTFSDIVDTAFEDSYPRAEDKILTAAVRWSVSDESANTTTKRQKLLKQLDSRTYVDGVLSLAIQITDALDHAHRQKIVHGDLKPSNILITPDGEPLLLDFNLSRDESISSWTCGGTLPYMPPEQLEYVAGIGDVQKHYGPDIAADIYSFGALLYELLTGITPVGPIGELRDTSTAAKSFVTRLKNGHEPIQIRNPLVGNRLQAVICKCLSYDRDTRPKSMADVKRELIAERALFATFWRRARSRPLISSIAACVFLLLFGSLATYVATRPPGYIADFEQGSQQAATGNANEAAEYFSAALASNPTYAPARFERGRSRIALGDLDLALDDFNELARTNKDARSMAYLGYCFNLKRLPAAAIPWYEEAIKTGTHSAPVHNNLGASYLDGSSTLSRVNRIRLAAQNLRIALDTHPTSSTVLLNIVRCSTMQSSSDPDYDPWSIWRDAWTLAKSNPQDSLVESHIALWYSAVQYRRSRSSEPEAAESASAIEEDAAHAFFASISQRLGTPIQSMRFEEAAYFEGADAKSSRWNAHRYYLPPVTASMP